MSLQEQYTIEDFYNPLAQRVTDYNAKLAIQSALISSGLDRNLKVFSKEEAKAICLALINKGGPSFQVGRDIYSRVQ